MEFGVLGSLLVHDGTREIPISSPRQRALLATLLLHAGSPVAADTLVEAVWDDIPPGARSTLHTYVTRLRKAVGADVAERIRTRGGSYLVEVRQGELDLHRFTALRNSARAGADSGDWPAAADLYRQAVAQFRGEPLADVPSGLLHREHGQRLAEDRLRALEQRIDADLALDRHADVVAELQTLVAVHPLREHFSACLMTALHRSGRRAEALACYQRARTALADELGIEPGAELRELHLRILRSEDEGEALIRVGAEPNASPVSAALVSVSVQPVSVQPVSVQPPAAQPSADPSPEPSPPPPPRPTPAHLPSAISDFTGRDDDLAALLDWLDPTTGAGSVAVVSGSGGIGKTSLAVRTAQTLRRHFPDGQLAVDLRAGAGTPVDPGVVLAGFLRDLGVDSREIPSGTDRRAALYRSAVAGRRLFILLDDALDAAQVRPLLPADPGCAVVVTSRNRLATLEGCRRVILGMLDPADARSLFARIIGEDRLAAEPEAAAAVLDGCGGLPLAIRVAAARLAARPSWTIASLAGQITDARRRLDELQVDDLAVRASFQVSYDGLARSAGDDDLQRALRLVSLWEGASLSLPAAAALLDLPAGSAETSLELLVDNNLLDSPERGVYRLHDLIRLCAAEMSAAHDAEPERTEAVGRVLRWYLHTAAAAHRRLAPLARQLDLDPPGENVAPLDFPDYEAALAWSSGEDRNLTAAVRIAERTQHDVVAWQLAMATAPYYQLDTPTADWLETFRIGCDAAHRLGDRFAEARMLNGLGIGYGLIRADDTAIEHLRQALQIRREIGDRRGEGATLANLGTVYERLDRFEEALECHSQSLAVARSVGNDNGASVALGNLVASCRGLKRYDEAIAHGREALELADRIGDRVGQGYVLHNVAGAHLEAGRPAAAVELLGQALEVRNALGDQRTRAETLADFGIALDRLGRGKEAAEAWTEAADVFEDLRDPRAARMRELLAAGPDSSASHITEG
ncbi:DNA-binding SARP family transcriptional activator [Catenulispora sp. GAS73]|uniref:AfsR/SARP family transcriptional regulator n=1 Tax=Catenulispora sp. GAS73 TaxID=3156269 RepID=UPI003515FF2C